MILLAAAPGAGGMHPAKAAHLDLEGIGHLGLSPLLARPAE